MPLHRTLKSICLDVVMFVGMFAIVGHLSINLWERYIIQTELTSMKTSLHSLKKTIHKIGFAYDNLHNELIELTEKKLSTKTDKKLLNPTKKIKHLYDRTDVKLETKVKAKEHTPPSLNYNKTTQNDMQILQKNKSAQSGLRDKKTLSSCSRNISTITRYPSRSTGVGTESEKNDYQSVYSDEKYCKYNTDVSTRKCCKYECCNNDRWKF